MKRIFWAFVSVGALLFAAQTASAQFGGSVVFCTNCSTLETQLLQYAEDVKSLAQQIQEVQNTLQIATNAVKNTEGLGSSRFQNLSGDLWTINQLAHQAQMLGGFTGQMLQNLGSQTGYPNANIAGWRQQFINGNISLSNAMTQAGSVFNLQQSQLVNDATTIASLMEEVMGDGGRQMTLQSIGGITSQEAQMNLKSQATLTTGMQAMMTYQTSQANRQALLDQMDMLQFQSALIADCAALAQNGGSTPECSGGNGGGGAAGAIVASNGD